MNDRLARGLFKTLVVLREYLPEIVVGGGWAPFLYHRYLFRDDKRYQRLRPIYSTKDWFIDADAISGSRTRISTISLTF